MNIDGKTPISELLGVEIGEYLSNLVPIVFPQILEKNKGPETVYANFSIGEKSIAQLKAKLLSLRIIHCPFLHEVGGSGILNTNCALRGKNICCAHPERVILRLLLASELSKRHEQPEAPLYLFKTEIKNELLKWRELQLLLDLINGSVRTRIFEIEKKDTGANPKALVKLKTQAIMGTEKDIGAHLAEMEKEGGGPGEYYTLLHSIPREQWYPHIVFSRFLSSQLDILTKAKTGATISTDELKFFTQGFHAANSESRDCSFQLVDTIRKKVLSSPLWENMV